MNDIKYDVLGDQNGKYTNLRELYYYTTAYNHYRRGYGLHSVGTYHAILLVVRSFGDRAGEADVLQNIGYVYYDSAFYTQALKYYQWSLEIQREINNSDGEITSLNTIGLVYDKLGQYPQALKTYQQALVILNVVGDPSTEGILLNNLGKLYEHLGEFFQALESYQKALVAHIKVDNNIMISITLNNLGLIYDYLGQHHKALEIYNQISPSWRETNTLVRRQHNIGLAYSHLGSYQQALEKYRDALLFLREGSDFAQENFDRALEAEILNSMGRAYKELGDYPQALKVCQEALNIFIEIGVRADKGLSFTIIGDIYNKFGQYKKAESNLFNAVEIWESLRAPELNDANKISLFETQSLTYRLLQEVLIAQHKIAEALEISERGRARAFIDLLNKRLSPNQTEQSKVTALNIEQIKQIAKHENATLVQYSISTDKFTIDGKRQTQDSELYIWVIKPTGEITFQRSDLKPLWQQEKLTLKQLVDKTRLSMGVIDIKTRDAGGIKVSAAEQANQPKRLQQLYDLLIKPIADILPSNPNDRVIFIPQGELFLVPFPALQYEQDKYLIEKHTILTAPSIQVLDFTSKQKRSVETLNAKSLIVGNPTMPKVELEPGKPPEQLTSLPGAEKEAKDVASILKTQALTGNEASKIAILQKMPLARIIHFATHGILDDNRGLGSAIALAPSGKDNGLLTAEEILNLKLSADLVVLSACDTGRGRITGDGVIGLSRSLISAGVPSVIVSLWAVDDNSTSFLMTEFYKNLQQKLDKATALYNSKRA